MTILRYELDSSVKGSVAVEEDSWTLCYDTEIESFYVDHEWGCVDPRNPKNQVRSGIRRYGNTTAWRGPGAEKLANGIATLRARAASGS